MAERNPLTTVGDTFTIRTSGARNSAVGVQTLSTTAAGATVVLEGSMGAGEFVAAKMKLFDLTSGDSLVGPGKAGYIEAVGFSRVRARLTVGGPASLILQEKPG